jgi:ABC-2 type transport system permease protein
METTAGIVNIRPGTARSTAKASSDAFTALLLRDLKVLRKNLGIFIARTLVQPFRLVFVFLFVFPQIGEGIGSSSPEGL